MSDLYWLTNEQMDRLRLFFFKRHGRPCVNDWRVLSGILFVDRNGLRWRDALWEQGPHKTLYNCRKNWSAMEIFFRIMNDLAAEKAKSETIMINTTYLKAHRTALSLRLKKEIQGD